ncbi:hypothetical protein C5167_017181 [Papaver somniferum]|uniref:Uncharacterized protein n=1 Tax=Papaver somniferum TaxID=3469 RepID=A0A4Y7IMQ4_PAPSO|nr:hypothetical protein C5167_017181 [Papaver somniferum]
MAGVAVIVVFSLLNWGFFSISQLCALIGGFPTEEFLVVVSGFKRWFRGHSGATTALGFQFLLGMDVDRVVDLDQ